MTNRKTLTKSLHTVTAVSRLATYLLIEGKAHVALNACRDALVILGQPNDWSTTDATLSACITACEKLVVLRMHS